MAQLSMFADHRPAGPAASADVDRVRRKLAVFLAEVQASDEKPLPSGRRRLIETVVPQMLRWLPEDEAKKTKEAFAIMLSA